MATTGTANTLIETSNARALGADAVITLALCQSEGNRP